VKPEAPLVVQADHTVLVETYHPDFERMRARLGRFAELWKSPEHLHFYRITPVSIWNAAALGESCEDILAFLHDNARFPLAPRVGADIEAWHRAYGSLVFLPADGERVGDGDDAVLVLRCRDAGLAASLLEQRSVRDFLAAGERTDELRFAARNRGVLKHCLQKLGWPVRDEAGYVQGAGLSFALRDAESAGADAAFSLRDYQTDAARAFWAEGHRSGGSGVIVLPCGAGKTIVGLATMHLLQTRTLVLTTNTTAVKQWKRELLEKTSLREEDVGEYTGEVKQIRPVTIATYQILTWRRRRTDPFVHFEIFEQGDWGLIVYDEVHLLPAPVFRATAAIQARRRLGLTATLVREDGREGDVFSLIGPKRYDLPWRELERRGFLASARCVELRVSMPEARIAAHDAAGARAKLQIASDNERKLDVVASLLEQHRGDRVLVIGHYLAQLRRIARRFSMPLITGETPQSERETLFGAFRDGRLQQLAVSKVGNFAIDLPDANVAIQVSGTYGSRQEEAQRLGRVLRPKPNGGGAVFYSVVSADSVEQEHAARRQLFLAEQGYAYAIVDAGDGRRGVSVDASASEWAVGTTGDREVAK
jgi:DNA excision repair protein ERCC-3